MAATAPRLLPCTVPQSCSAQSFLPLPSGTGILSKPHTPSPRCLLNTPIPQAVARLACALHLFHLLSSLPPLLWALFCLLSPWFLFWVCSLHPQRISSQTLSCSYFPDSILAKVFLQATILKSSWPGAFSNWHCPESPQWLSDPHSWSLKVSIQRSP